MREGELLRRWEELRKRWKFWIPVMSVDKFIRDAINEMQEEYPTWEECVEDISEDAVISYIKRVWKWIFKWI